MTKKLLCLTMAIILGIGLGFAKSNPLRMQSGSLAQLRDAGGHIYCHIDFSKTRANRKPLAEYLENDYGSDMSTFEKMEGTMYKWFAERWDDDIDDGPKISMNEDSPFTAHITIRTLQLGSNAGAGMATISGYAEFYTQGTDTPFAKVEIPKMAGTILGGGVPGYAGLFQTFNDLAEYLCDMIHHAK